MTNEELLFIINAIKDIIENVEEWQNDYKYDQKTNEFYYKDGYELDLVVDEWFNK